MNYKKTKNKLEVVLSTDFNLNAVRQIQKLLKDREHLYIDTSNSRFINSEAIIFMHRYMDEGKKLEIKNPPRIFYIALHILGLHEVWDLKTIITP
jgi:hypothetical protein